MSAMWQFVDVTAWRASHTAVTRCAAVVVVVGRSVAAAAVVDT